MFLIQERDFFEPSTLSAIALLPVVKFSENLSRTFFALHSPSLLTALQGHANHFYVLSTYLSVEDDETEIQPDLRVEASSFPDLDANTSALLMLFQH